MGENSSHAPGTEIKVNDSAVRQRHGMASGDGAMGGGNFGVGSLPGTMTAGRHGSHMKSDGMTFGDSERAGPPPLKVGSGMMRATAHSNHGPHK
jgi:hypothetical protein